MMMRSMRVPRSAAAMRQGSAAVVTLPRAVASAPRRAQAAEPRRRACRVTAAEEPAAKVEDAPAPEDIPTESGPESDSEAAPEPSAIEAARMLLSAEAVDKDAMEDVLAKLEEQMESVQAGVFAAEARATAAESTAATARDQLVRLTADFENFRRRTKAEKDAVGDSARGDIVTQLLPVVDNFEMARTQVKCETEGEEKINTSYQNLYKQFVDFLRALGVEATPGVGSQFDPNFHEAIMKEESADVPDNTVLQEFRKGFKIGDKLLRPAMVKISENNSAPAPAAAEPTTEPVSEEDAPSTEESSEPPAAEETK
ncbi:hypothetical protein FOA52_014349 [Chlamydomonas sp. UWO 241]|nr:hypothetical protein FOA52_014349 [Chlamydomonas sp. UWO 241]